MAHQQGTYVGVVEVNGASIAYEVAGAGHPLILVHAGIADRQMWDEQFDIFAQHYRVIRYDMRGYGQTPMVAGPFAHWRDLHALLVALDISRAYLLGCSLGGSTVLDCALEYPDMAAALIIVGSAPSGYGFVGEPPLQLPALDAALKAGNLREAAELEVQIWVDGRQRTPDQVEPSVRDRVREMNIIALGSALAELGEPEPLDPPALGRLAEISAPTLLVVGDLDEPNILAAVDQLASTIPGASRAVIPGTAHFPNMERPDEFNQVVSDFLAGLPASAR